MHAAPHVTYFPTQFANNGVPIILTQTQNSTLQHLINIFSGNWEKFVFLHSPCLLARLHIKFVFVTYNLCRKQFFLNKNTWIFTKKPVHFNGSYTAMCLVSSFPYCIVYWFWMGKCLINTTTIPSSMWVFLPLFWL